MKKGETTIKRITRFWVEGGHPEKRNPNRTFKIEKAAFDYTELLRQKGYIKVEIYKNVKIFKTERIL